MVVSSMVWTRQRIALAAGAVAVVAALVIGLVLAFSGSPAPKRAAPKLRPDAPLTSPFTGERVSSLSRVLAVKIDNIVNARPQTGLSQADIVYVLPVEGGLSRFLAVFSSHLPPVAGPVRSAREDDIAMLRQFGTPAFAYSGATPVLLPYIHRTARIVDLYAGIVPGPYYRDNSRIAPYNFYARPSQLLARAPHASKARDIGFRFGPPPAGGKATGSVGVSYQAASFTFSWSPTAGRWLVTMDGTPARTTDGGRLSAATVVIQHTTVTTSRFLEYGSRPPYAVSTGSGTATVLRDGRAYQARWSRPDASGGTTFTTLSGRPMTFATGPVWVVLAR
jgi:Protein of unknown function (DUF3048) N-terminal domain/Protein of unknown function (DUF3048) C-terminal domain